MQAYKSFIYSIYKTNLSEALLKMSDLNRITSGSNPYADANYPSLVGQYNQTPFNGLPPGAIPAIGGSSAVNQLIQQLGASLNLNSGLPRELLGQLQGMIKDIAQSRLDTYKSIAEARINWSKNLAEQASLLTKSAFTGYGGGSGAIA
ncbi:MAG: hypothetical protein SFT81_03500 [Candidatus Caenarcaniphilales bacterium]|nr:hypothetical protein [Candidatus Caenarcaniphilales bacterium]